MSTKIGLVTLAIAAAANTGFSQVTFTEITTGPVVTDPGVFTPSVWIDLNKDGLLDLFVPNWSLVYPNVLYWNNGNSTFTSFAAGYPPLDTDNHMSAAGADHENDGNPGLFVTAGWPNPSTNSLYHSNGDGTFERVNMGDLTSQPGVYWGCSWADYDLDGFADLIVARIDTQRNQLWHNNGNGSFTRVTGGPIGLDPSVASGFLWADYDGDGLMDLLVLNVNTNRHYLYHNDGHGAFSRVLTNAIALDTWADGSQGAAWGDYDSDGLEDLVITDHASHMHRLYHNNGDGTFTRITSALPLPPSGSSPLGCAWGDFDNDGYLDLIICNQNGTYIVLHNHGDGTFTKVDSGFPPYVPGPGVRCNGPCWVDYDNDGFLDLFIVMGQDDVSLNGWATNLLYHNNGNTNAWLEIKPVGTVSNRSAIGAKVRVRAVIGGKTMWQMRELHSGTGWGSETLVAHFGLGNATNVDTVCIEWPSGTVQELHDIAPRQILSVYEPSRLLAEMKNGVPQFSLQGGRGFKYQIEASTDLATWSAIRTITIANPNGTALISDTNAPSSDRRFFRAVRR